MQFYIEFQGKDVTERRHRIEGNAEAFLTGFGISSGMLTRKMLFLESFCRNIVDYVCAYCYPVLFS